MNTDILGSVLIVLLGGFSYGLYKGNIRLINAAEALRDHIDKLQGDVRRLKEQREIDHKNFDRRSLEIGEFKRQIEHACFGNSTGRPNNVLVSAVVLIGDRLSKLGVDPADAARGVKYYNNPDANPTVDTRPSSPSPGVPAKAQQPTANSQVSQTQA